MKTSITLLAPTDFSKAARNSVNYAVEMAKRIKAKIILVHVYSPPVMVSEVPMIIPLPAESEVYHMKKLKRLKNNLLAGKGCANLDIEVMCRCGITVDEIYLLTLERKIDFVVMGLQGKGFIKESLVGSTTTRLIWKPEVPVLSIDHKVKFKNPKRIVFATDKAEKLQPATMQSLVVFSKIFKSHFFILNVVMGNGLLSIPDTVVNKNMNKSFKDFDHSIHKITSVSVVQGLSDFIALKKIDMLVMVPHDHTLTERVLNGRQTKMMAFHSTIPLLTLHEKTTH